MTILFHQNKSNVGTLKIEIKGLKLQIAKNSGIVALYNSEHTPSSAWFVHNARRKKFQNERANRKQKDSLGNMMNIDDGSKKRDHLEGLTASLELLQLKGKIRYHIVKEDEKQSPVLTAIKNLIICTAWKSLSIGSIWNNENQKDCQITEYLD